jgi:hypothetical protein
MMDTPLIKSQLAHTLEALRKKKYGPGGKTPMRSFTTERAAAAAAGRTPTEEQE